MKRIKKEKSTSSHYPRLFLWRWLYSALAWTIFAILFVVVGRKFVNVDILRNICQIFRKDWKFNQWFIGNSFEDKFKLLNYGLYFIIAIIGLNFIALLYNTYLWKKDRYIENNDFYLHTKWMFLINTLIHIASAFLLTISFLSAFTALLALVFMIFNAWEPYPPSWKEMKTLRTEKFFSWQNSPIYKIFLYSTIIVIAIPFIKIYLVSLYEKKALKDLINTFPFAKSFMEMLQATDSTFDALYWIIFGWFTRGIIFDRIKEFGDFWTKINAINKRVVNYCHHYYYQESWALANENLINLGDYSYLESSPDFLSKEYLESDLEIEKFARQNQRVVKYIQFCESKIKEPAKKNFLHYCLFNEFASWKDCLRTKQLINAQIRKIT